MDFSVLGEIPFAGFPHIANILGQMHQKREPRSKIYLPLDFSTLRDGP